MQKKSLLTSSQRRRRLTWAKTYGTCFYRRVCYQSYSSTRKVRIRRTSNEKYNNTLTQPVMRHGSKIHVRRCFISQEVELLKRIHANMNDEKYHKEILHDIHIVGKCLVFPKSAFIFQHDLDSQHRTKST